MQKVFLIVAAVLVYLGGARYGLMPAQTMGEELGIPADTVNQIHLFRAIMGIYWATATLWVIGAFKPELARTAIISLIVFMGGALIARLVSFGVDGIADGFFIQSAVIEVVFVGLAFVLLRKAPAA
jgi:hypothetical protein